MKKILFAAETTFLVYRVPQSKIDETIEFVSKLDFEKVISIMLMVCIFLVR